MKVTRGNVRGCIEIAVVLMFCLAFLKAAIGYYILPEHPPYMSDGVAFSLVDNSDGHINFCSWKWREVRSFSLDSSGKITSVGY